MKYIVTTLLLFIVNCSFGQLVTSTAQSPASLVQNVFLGPGVTASNIQFTGSPSSIGSFTANNTNLGISSGIVFTTGTVLNNGDGPQGPNNKASSGVDNKTAGFSLLDNLISGTGYTTLNAAYLQLDFIPQSDTVRFKYVFGSEEYPEFAPPNNSGYNDIFAFFISGPGISGQQNIALLPSGSNVSINNVNPITNSTYYVTNGDGSQAPYNSSTNYIQYDGFTKVLTAVSKVQCGQTYHLILAIADVQDGIYDSGIFLEANSLKADVDIKIGNALSSNPYGDDKLLAEGCVSNTITITRSGNNLPAATFPINVTGSATPGIDYSPPIPSSIIFLAGETSKQITFSALGDRIHEGIETILLAFNTYDACGNLKIINVEYQIRDADSLFVTVNTGSASCPGDDIEVRADVTGGVGPFDFIWNTGETSQTITVQPSTNTIYSVSIQDNCLLIGASDDGTVVVVQPTPIVINQIPDISEVCPYILKTLESNVSGGVPPYTYIWTATAPPSLGTSATQNVKPKSTTEYMLEVTDHCGLKARDTVIYTITSSELLLTMNPSIEVCPGDSVQIWVKPSGGTPFQDSLYYYSWKNSLIKDSSFWVNPTETTTYTVEVSDSCQTFTVEGKTTITVVKPTANFQIESKVLFNNLLITFQNLTLNGSHYSWEFGDGNSSFITNPNNTYLDPGNYIVTLIAADDKGCLDSIKKPIEIEEEYYVYIPNAFTPDGGRINETFRASTIGIKSLKIIICNRWGQIVFSSEDQYFKWDGTLDGKICPDGLYTYKVSCISNSNRYLDFLGHIALLK